MKEPKKKQLVRFHNLVEDSYNGFKVSSNKSISLKIQGQIPVFEVNLSEKRGDELVLDKQYLIPATFEDLEHLKMILDIALKLQI